MDDTKQLASLIQAAREHDRAHTARTLYGSRDYPHLEGGDASCAVQKNFTETSGGSSCGSLAFA